MIQIDLYKVFFPPEYSENLGILYTILYFSQTHAHVRTHD